MYDRKLNDRVLTFRVSGKLWNRSLVMMDSETESLWSHILGEAMAGELKGTQLTAIPSDIVTWRAWKSAHPESTVLAMNRTRVGYTREFYRQSGAEFVVGFAGNSGMHHASFATLKRHPLLNVDAQGVPLVISFELQSTSVRLYSRKLAERVLSFAAEGQHLRDSETGSLWDRTSGKAIDGPLKGKRLSAHVGIVSYAKAWLTFHPDSRAVPGP